MLVEKNSCSANTEENIELLRFSESGDYWAIHMVFTSQLLRTVFNVLLEVYV